MNDTHIRMLEIILGMSDHAVDPQAKAAIRTILDGVRGGRDMKDDVLNLLDSCICYAWTSNREILALEYIWSGIGTADDVQRIRSAREVRP